MAAVEQEADVREHDVDVAISATVATVTHGNQVNSPSDDREHRVDHAIHSARAARHRRAVRH